MAAPPAAVSSPTVGLTRATAASMSPARSRAGIKPLLVVLDMAAVVLAMQIAYRLKAHVPGASVRHRGWAHLVVSVASLPVWAACFSQQRLYTARCVTSAAEEFRRIVRATVAGVVGMMVIGFVVKVYVARGWLGLVMALGLVLVTVERAVVRRIFAAERRHGRLLRRVVLVGTNDEAAELADMLGDRPSLGYEIVGFVGSAHQAVHSRRTLGGLDDTVGAVRRTGATGVLIATTAVTLDTSNRLARQLTDAGIHVELSSSLRDVAPERLAIRSLGGFPIVYVEPVRRNGLNAAAKRLFDVVGAAVALLLTLPLLVVAAAAIKVSSRGPVLFRQSRIGRRELPFSVLKLRTMVEGAEAMLPSVVHLNEADGPLFKVRKDPRITFVGRGLRKLSIDELPQLWNVLRGEMSLVGPRPALAREVDAWSPQLRERLRVRPGITGMWQVYGRSKGGGKDSYERLDLYYVDNWSLTRDLVLLAKTVPAVLSTRGAY